MLRGGDGGVGGVGIEGYVVMQLCACACVSVCVNKEGRKGSEVLERKIALPTFPLLFSLTPFLFPSLCHWARRKATAICAISQLTGSQKL